LKQAKLAGAIASTATIVSCMRLNEAMPVVGSVGPICRMIGCPATVIATLAPARPEEKSPVGGSEAVVVLATLNTCTIGVKVGVPVGGGGPVKVGVGVPVTVGVLVGPLVFVIVGVGVVCSALSFPAQPKRSTKLPTRTNSPTR
jgi:hypothetical protein